MEILTKSTNNDKRTRFGMGPGALGGGLGAILVPGPRTGKERKALVRLPPLGPQRGTLLGTLFDYFHNLECLFVSFL